MKPRLYIETTIPSYLAARPSGDAKIAARQRITLEWWQTRRPLFELFVSPLVLEECRAGDPDAARERLKMLIGLTILVGNEAIIEIAETLMRKAAFPTKAVGDALHIAFAIEHGCDYFLTWNYRHIVNPQIKRAVHGALGARMKIPSICTPEDLMG